MKTSERDILILLGRLDERTEAIKEKVDSNSDKLDIHNGDIASLKTEMAGYKRMVGQARWAFGAVVAVIIFFQAEIVEVVTRVLGG